MSFSINDLLSAGATHDVDPATFSGFVGKITPELRAKALRQREERIKQDRREAAMTPHLKTLGHLADHLVGLTEEMKSETPSR
jgi:hypothetical protein